MDFRALGPLLVLDDGGEVPIDGGIRRRLLAALLVHAGTAVSHAALERAAWGDEVPASARRVVQSHLSRLRSLGLGVHRSGSGYLLDVTTDAVDAHRFRALGTGPCLRRSSAADLREALGWWRGDPWPDLADSFPVADHRELIECRAAVRERLALLELRAGSHRPAAAAAEATLQDDPRRETAWVLWALALYCEQRRGDALRVLHDGRTAIGAVGLAPAPLARDVEDAIIGERPSGEVVLRVLRALDDASPAVEAGEGDRRSRTVRLPAAMDRRATDPVFRGRQTELAALETAWEEAAAGGFRVALLAGEPGIGKTRLARELAVAVHRRGAVVVHGACDAELDAAFQPVLEGLRAATSSADAERAVPAPALDGAGGLDVTAAPTVGSDPETERFRAISALVEAVEALAAGAGVLVVLDDLQWCDAGTGQVLRRMVRDRPARVMVVGTHRDGEVRAGTPWAVTLPELLRHPIVEEHRLGGLGAEAVAELVVGSLGPAGRAPTALAEELVELTGGNALFVGEVLQHLLDAGGVVREEGGWRLERPLGELGIPARVREVIGRRIRAGHARALEVMEAAAVIGQRFSSAPLRSLAGDDPVVDEVLEAMLAGGLVSELAAGTHEFAHALIRSAVLDGMSATRRARLHLSLVEVLEDDPAVRAPHWQAAAALQPDLLHRAIDCSVDAGDQAVALRSPDSAIAHYRRALDLAGRAPRSPDWRLRVETKLGTAERQVGETGHRRRLLAVGREALDAGMTQAAAEAVLATYSGIPSRYLQSNAAMLGLLDEILERAGDLPVETTAALAALRATEAMFSSDGVRRRAAAAEAVGAVEAATGSLEASVQARALSAALMSHVTAEPFDRQDVVDRLDRLCPQLAPRDRVVGRASLIQLHVARGEMGPVPAWLADAREVCAEVGEPELRSYFAMVEVQHALLTQGVRAARAALVEMAASARQGDAWMARMTEPFGWTADMFAGHDLATLADAYDAGIAARPDLPLLRATAAYTLARAGREDRAREHLDALAATGFDRRDRTWGYVAMLVLSALTAAQLRSRHRTALRALLARCRVVVPLQPMPHDTPAHAIGVIDASLGAHDSAVEQLERARGVYRRIGAPLFAARSDAELALVLAARGHDGDRERARVLVRRARSAARACGLGDLPDVAGVG